MSFKLSIFHFKYIIELFFSLQTKVVILFLVQDEEKVGIEAAIIKIDSVEEPTKTDTTGKLSLSKEYGIGRILSIEVSKTGYYSKSKSITVKDNDEEDLLVTIELEALSSNWKSLTNYFSRPNCQRPIQKPFFVDLNSQNFRAGTARKEATYSI